MINKERKFTGALLSTAAAAALTTGGVANAQEDDGARRLSTVTVTSTQRVESIQDVPIAVTALDPETLDRAGVADIKTLDSVSSSFNMNTSDTESGGITLRLRGVGTTGNNIGLESSVGVFLDGVYLSRPGIALADLLDLEQLEILRGPQGTLFGRNTSAGALNIKTKAPNLEEVEAFANLTLGNYNLINSQAGLNIPIIEDKFGVRISGAIRERDGFVEGINGSQSATRDRLTLRGQALYDGGEIGSLRVILDYAEGEDECCDAVWFQDFTGSAATFAAAGIDGNGGFPLAVGDNALESTPARSNSENFANPFEQIGFSAEYKVDTGIGELTYIGSYRDYEAGSFRNTDYTGLDIFTVGDSPEARAAGPAGELNFDPLGGATIETTTHELRLQNTAFNDRLDWLVGLYYSEEEIDTRGSLTLLDEYQAGLAGGAFGGTNVLAAYSGVALGGPNGNGDFATNRFFQDAESVSIFTHNVFSVTDRLDLTLGLRYVEETKDGSFEQLGGQHDACIATLNNAEVATAVPALAPFYGNAVALNCFVFAAPTVDPVTGGRVGQIDPGLVLGAAAGNVADATGFGTALALLPREFDDTFEDEELVYTIKASYKINDVTNIYGGFTHGFKSGGFNLDAGSAIGGADPRFDSEKIDAIEIGLKTDFWDGRARANIAAFIQEMEDFQVLEFTGIQFQTFNVAKAESTGVEVETQAQFTDHFAGSLGLTWTDAKYPNDCATQDATDPNFILQAASLCGNPLTNAPEWVAILGGTYEREALNGAAMFFATGSVRYETERRTSTQAVTPGTTLKLPGDFQDDNTKVNLRVGLEAPDERWAVELWGNNIFDERTKNVTFNIPLRGSSTTEDPANRGFANLARGQFVQDPATYGVTLRVKY